MGKRSYLNQPLTAFFEEIDGDISFDAQARDGNDLAELFFELTRHLGKKLHINKGVLIIKKETGSRLAAISTWNNGHTRDGLTIDLPREASLFAKIAEQGMVYTEDFCGSFSGNFFERKLLLDDDSRSFAIQPLKSEGRIVGLLGYSSEEPTAFSVLEEGLLQDVADRFGEFIQTKVNPNL